MIAFQIAYSKYRVKKGSGRYANEVVIQQHPVIVTNSDKTIKVVCSFENLDRTVTLGALFPGASPGLDVTTRFQLPVTAIVTNTAPPPNLVMRVLDRTGRDAGVVGLGDELMLRIELREPASNLAIFARNLYARSKNGESLFLIDSTGCPTDPSIFPGLNLDARDRKSLFANFKAFRFPSTGLVNFEVQIRFCQDQCKPVRCSNNMESFGRKKRDIHGGTTAHSPSTPSSITHHNSTKDNFSTASTQRHAHSNSHESNMKLSPFTPHRFTPPLRNGTAWASNVTQVFGTFRVISSTESTVIKKGASDAIKAKNNWRNVHADNYLHRGLMNRSASASDTPINPGQRNLMDERKLVADHANRWRYHTADGVQDDFSALPNRERPSSMLRQQSKEYPQSSRPPNPFMASTTSPKVVNKSSRNYYSSPKHISQFTTRHIEQNDTYQGRGYGYVPTRREFVPHTASTPGRWPSKPMPSNGNPHRRPTPNRYYAYNTHVPPNGTTSSGDGRKSNASPYSDSSIPPSSLTTPELVISTMVPVPDELPLSLAIMVGEDTGVDVSSWKSKMKNVNSLESQADIESVGMVCTTVTTIAATTVTLSIAHVLGLIGAYCCYKWHRKSKRKKILQKSLKLPRPQPPPTAMRRPSGGRQEELFYAKPDVSFRNVYGSYGSSP
ncbi:uncharacterized protein NPIL_395251 [Nephila pilipes]|uniref:ZP domain-containing protein n=1 Tax=Nephila pilipes TaxID=299642 RepID=A0A8X6UG96_NEPPI|nr:uncharacterized protein NPIL_395251 [Nephila pilipes]